MQPDDGGDRTQAKVAAPDDRRIGALRTSGAAAKSTAKIRNEPIVTMRRVMCAQANSREAFNVAETSDVKTTIGARHMMTSWNCGLAPRPSR